jgi:hypothetical protein
MTDQLNPSPLPVERSKAAVAVDDLVRRYLRVSDPRDPEAVSKALRERYADERIALEQEVAGLPFFPIRLPPPTLEIEGVTGNELAQAKDDVERDLAALLANAALKDVRAELQGWTVGIRRIIADGTAAARFGLDPRQRDAAMAARRMLCGYARLARYVGALTPNQGPAYRQLAKSLDEVSAMLLVLLGNSIASVGQGGARFLLQAPASELQARRDAVIYALRNLVGTTQEGYGPNDWPRGLVAYRQFIQRLEVSGHSDLRALFQENYVARALDELLQWSTSGTGDDLRALGAMAHLVLERFRRLIMLAVRLVDPESPPLASYLSAVQLFLDAFENGSSGARLLYIGRPPILFYGLYGMSGPDPATTRLIELLMERGRLADELDCYLGCGCAADDVKCQIILDKILFDVDRAIDLYALGSASTQEPEQRAAAYGVLIDRLLATDEDWLNGARMILCPGDTSDQSWATCAPKTCVAPTSRLWQRLSNVRDCLWWKGESGGCIAATATATDTKGWELAPITQVGNQNVNIPGYVCNATTFAALAGVVARVIADVTAIEPAVPLEDLVLKSNGDSVSGTLLEHRDICYRMHQELCLQQAMEQSWTSLLKTMAPSCFRFNGDELLATKSLLGAAIARVQIDRSCEQYQPDIPPHFETSLAAHSYWRNSEGGNT